MSKLRLGSVCDMLVVALSDFWAVEAGMYALLVLSYRLRMVVKVFVQVDF